MRINPKLVLASSTVFDGFQSLVGMPNLFNAFFGTYVQPKSGDKILDLGCGVAATLRHVPAGIDYTGVDISPKYIAAARAKFGDRGTFLTSDIADASVAGKDFDCAIAVGVMHHLDDETACSLLKLARASLRPGGCLYTIDPCYVPGQSWLGAWLTSNDRGQFVRQPSQYRRLFDSYGKSAVSIVPGLLRIPYTHLIAKVAFA